MKELNIGPNLIKNRRRRGITQEALAEYMGVSNASVSKWETGATYPDITLLPQLATFFHISIDELIGYEPQMTKEDIRRLYRQICQGDVHAVACGGLLCHRRLGLLRHLSRHELALLFGFHLLLGSARAAESICAHRLVAGGAYHHQLLQQHRGDESVLLLDMRYLTVDFYYPAAPRGTEEAHYIANFSHSL